MGDDCPATIVDKVVWAAELTHRGFQIRDDLTTRRQVRRSRRNKATRAEVEKRVTSRDRTPQLV